MPRARGSKERHSINPEILGSVVNPDGFVAILPTSPIFKRPKYPVPDDGVLAAVREAKGNLVVCGSDPIHFVLNGDGLYQSLAPGGR